MQYNPSIWRLRPSNAAWANRAFLALYMVVVAAWSSAPAVAQELNKDLPDYRTQINPLLAARCVTCQACSDAPCQLNLSSFEGVDRVASKAKIYEGNRLENR